MNNFSGSLITWPAWIFSLATSTGTVSGAACLALIRAVRYAATRPQPMATNIITKVFDFIAAHLRVRSRTRGRAPDHAPVGRPVAEPGPAHRGAPWQFGRVVREGRPWPHGVVVTTV